MLGSPSDYLITPIVEEAEREVGCRAGSARFHDDTKANKESIGLALSVNSRWFVQVYIISLLSG